MSDWKEYRLGDCIEFIIDNRGKNPPLSDSGYELIETNMISSNNKYPDFDKVTKYVSEGTYNNWFRKGHPKIGDILISTVGNIGKVAIVNEDKGCIAQNLIGLRVNKKIIAEYLYYFLIKKDTQDQLLSLNIGSVQPSIKVPHLLNLEIKIPELLKQKECIQVLSKLDDKIQLNTQINQTLEKIAQALFKSWFVDFDPVRAKAQAISDGLSLEQAELAAMQAISGKTPEELTALSQTQPDRYAELAETAKAFPCEMEEVSNSIYIPKGWKIKYFNEIIDTYIDNRGKTPPIEKQGIPLLEVKHLSKNSVFPDLNTTKYISNDTYENWLRNKPEALDIMLSTVGTVGRVNLVPTNNKIAIAQNILGFRFNLEKATQIYMFYLMKSEKFIFDMEARVVETVQKSIKRKDLEKIPLLIPTLELQNLFSKFIIPFVIKQNNSENTNLEKIRNDLLPKLLSGEIQL